MEAPLADFKNSEELEAWLQGKPREVAVALAARAALRVLPFVQEALRYKPDYIVLQVFRALAFAWGAARYSIPTKGDAAPPIDLGQFGLASAAATSAAGAAQAARAAVSNPSLAGGVFHFAVDAVRAADASAALATDAAAFWSAVSNDAKRVEGGATASVIAGLPLWPWRERLLLGPNPWSNEPNVLHEEVRPERLRSLWQEMKAALLDAKQDWQVWTDWYEDRLEGRVREEQHELAYVRIGNDLWKQGPAIVNAEIKRLTGIKAPRRRIEQERSPAEVKPPEAPLPPPSPATRFIVRQGIVDVVPPTAWSGREAQVATYHAQARTITFRFADKLANTDAEPELAASVHTLVEVLGDDPTQLQPDQLRLASRTIAAKARAYGHPSARWELSAESVSALFELADVLVSLQALATPELEEHERAIRALDLTEDSVTEAKEGLDLVAEAIAAVSEMVSEHASVAFEASANASDNAISKTVQVAIEGDRILLAENLVLALARALAVPESKSEVAVKPPLASDSIEKERPAQRRKPKTQGHLKTTWGRTARQKPNEESWEDLKGRFIARLQAKGPEALADATLDAVTSTIKHSPKAIPALAGLIFAAIGSAPVLLAAGSGLSVSLLWVGYELWKRKKPPA